MTTLLDVQIYDWIIWLLYKMYRHITGTHDGSLRCRHMTGPHDCSIRCTDMTGSHDYSIRCTDIWLDHMTIL